MKSCSESMLLALINGNLIDGTGSNPIPDAIVVIQNECICTIGKQNTIDIPVIYSIHTVIRKGSEV